MVQDSGELRPDICVVGAGAGGFAAAAAAAAMGVAVVLVEKGRMGGASLYGAVPARALAVAAQRADALRNGARFGTKVGRSAIDFLAVSAYVRGAIAAIAPQHSRQRAAGLGVQVIEGAARFVDADTVAVGDVTIKARRFVVATGSMPVIPAIAGLTAAPYLTDQTIFDLTDCPRHLIVIGGGRRGLELAQTFRRLGSEVTVLEAATPLADEDRECAGVVLDTLAREGIRIRAGVQVAQVRRVLARIQVALAGPQGAADGSEVIEGTHLLVAAGRRPNIDALDLDLAGVRHGADGIVVDKRLRTSNKRVYAIGDVIGGPKFTHVAQHHAGLVIRNALFRVPVKLNHRAIPQVTYTAPELARVGLQEDEARKQAKVIRVLRWGYGENDRALTAAVADGHIKVVTDRYGAILGVTLVGPAASENIASWALAIGQKLHIGAVAGVVAPYPTYTEVGKRAAITYFMRSLTSTRVRRIMGWLRRFG